MFSIHRFAALDHRVGIKQKIPDAGSGMIEVRYVFLLTFGRYAYRDLPTMRGLNVMMVMLARVHVIHIGRNSTIDVK